MQQGRWVSYIYRYRNNVKCENAGFIKGQRISGGPNRAASVRFQIGLKLYKKKACKCTVYLLYDQNKARYLTDIYLAAEERDAIMTRIELPWDEPIQNGKDIEAYDGLFFQCDDGEILTGLWNEYPVNPAQIVVVSEEIIHSQNTDEHPKQSELNPDATVMERDFAEAAAVENVAVEAVSEAVAPEVTVAVEAVPEAMAPEETVAVEAVSEAAVPEETVAVEAVREAAVPEETAAVEAVPEDSAPAEAPSGECLSLDACQNILNTYPKLPLFVDSQFIECVKIVPHDIGKLAISNWKLGVNSFVSHGYYHYRYLMLGRVRFEQGECVVIGVPGVFTNKEKYLANMFGFDTFIPVKRAKNLTGNFGYWVSEVLRE